jgi:primosomal protein N' (replication factor Y)
MQAIRHNDRNQFVETESYLRNERNLPPFGQLVSIIVSCENEEMLKTACLKLSANIPTNENDIEVLGPANAILYKLRKNFRKRFLIKINKNKNCQKIISDWINKSQINPKVRIQIDIDPYSFL